MSHKKGIVNKIILLFLLTSHLFSCQINHRNLDGEASNKNKVYTGPIIDMHIHAFTNESPQIGVENHDALKGKVYVGSKSAAEHQTETMAKFRQYNIVKAVVSPQSSERGDAPAEPWHESAPEIVLIGDNQKLSVDALRQKYSEGKLHLLAEMAPMYLGISPDDEILNKYFDLAEELDIPFGYHLLPGGPPGAAYTFASQLGAKQAKPLQIEEVLVAHPKMRIYICHAGWPYLDDMKAFLYAHPQLYVDVGLIDWLIPRKEYHNFLKGLIDAGFGNRIMFGTDQMI